ncbi:MAG: DUF4389 domain-containing protein [Mariprofundaceae bacterium]|nr:DUF4389 domain-containing protein [Mariprofundaceae bacterium]
MDKFDTQGVKENIQDGGVWMRLLFMLLFSIIYSVAEVVLVMVVVFQFFCVLFSGKRNDQVLSLGAQISFFIYQVLRYLTYNSDERPYPFSAWPQAQVEAKAGAASKAETASAGKPLAADADTAKTAAKKPAAKRKPVASKAKPVPRKKSTDEAKPVNPD